MNEFNISALISEISGLHNYLQQHSFQQVNSALTIRNWMVGLYILEYEQNGSDRALYGAKVLKEMEARFKKKWNKRIG